MSDTATSSQSKLENLYKIVYEDLDGESKPENSQQSGDIDSDTSDQETEIGEHVPDGIRTIDDIILSASISAKLVCEFCHSNVELIEVERKGLRRTFAFYCSNKHCDDHNHFHSSEVTVLKICQFIPSIAVQCLQCVA